MAEPVLASTLFLKIERLRRLHRCDQHTFTVERGSDGTFGLGLSEDNVVVRFHHEANTRQLRVNDQVCGVGDVPLVREPLAALLERHFADADTVQLHITRPSVRSERSDVTGEAFAALQLRDKHDDELEEWLSELWTLRTESVWGTFWTMPIVAGARSAWLGLYLSKLFTEPLLGCVDIPLNELAREVLETRWYPLRAEHARKGSRAIEGEVLVTTRLFASAASVSPATRANYLSDSDDDSVDGPIDHATEPLKPVPEPSAPEDRGVHGSSGVTILRSVVR